jgi:hypothetical protein
MKTIKLKLEAPWEEVKEHLKENDLHLTDADLDYLPGREEELINRLQKIMNRPRNEIILYIESISANKDQAG